MKLVPIEIKSGETIVQDYFKGLAYWSELTQLNPEFGYIVYGGTLQQKRSAGTVLGWQAAGNLIEKLEKRD